jgi:hypothetical protein
VELVARGIRSEQTSRVGRGINEAVTFGYYIVYRKELLEKPSFARLREHLLGQL